ncbi:unnamed protein product [Absidia cylindrospora]
MDMGATIAKWIWAQRLPNGYGRNDCRMDMTRKLSNGYGLKNCQMVMDAPKGYVTRIGRLKDWPYPVRDGNYVSRIIPLLRLATFGKTIMTDTIEAIDHSRTTEEDSSTITRPPLPPTFSPSASSSSSLSSSLTSSSKKTKHSWHFVDPHSHLSLSLSTYISRYLIRSAYCQTSTWLYIFDVLYPVEPNCPL